MIIYGIIASQFDGIYLSINMEVLWNLIGKIGQMDRSLFL